MFGRLNKVEKIILYIILSVIGITLSAPFIYMISVSLASSATTSKMAFSFIPTEFEWRNYIRVFTDKQISKWFFNSVVLVVFSIIGQVFASSFVAYGFARLKGRGKNIIFMILLGTMMIPSQVTIIPQFMIFRKLGWINTLLPIIVPNFCGGAFNIFLIRQFIVSIPTSLDEAAKIDGLGFFGIYWKIILPLIKPTLVMVAILTFNYNWGLFMEPLIYINDVGRMPLALGVQILSATRGAGAAPEWNIVMVASMLLTLPMILVFFLGQKYVFEANIIPGSSTIK